MSSHEEKTKLIECPICSKQFSATTIENHVSKCLFLNESAGNEGSMKRSFSKEDNVVTKKAKHSLESHGSFHGNTQYFTSASSDLSNQENFEHEKEKSTSVNKVVVCLP
jgi:4-aminobutyrate aminotransferase-like enzyme